jgi:hypothetical protein
LKDLTALQNKAWVEALPTAAVNTAEAELGRAELLEVGGSGPSPYHADALAGQQRSDSSSI